MPNAAPQPYWYLVKTEQIAVTPHFEYVVDQGTTIASLFYLVEVDGHWQEIFGFTSLTVSPYGDGGSQMTLQGTPYSPDPSMGGMDITLVLAFNAAIDFLEPLPLDQLVKSASVYTVHTWSVTGLNETTNYAVEAVIPIQPKRGS